MINEKIKSNQSKKINQIEMSSIIKLINNKNYLASLINSHIFLFLVSFLFSLPLSIKIQTHIPTHTHILIYKK